MPEGGDLRATVILNNPAVTTTGGTPKGVPANAYVAVVQYKAKAKSQEDMANYINSLSLTKSQKDALWCLWWSEETLKQTPWWK